MDRPDSFFTKAWRDVILDASIDGVVTIDENSVILEWSRSAHEIFGHTKEEAVGRYMPDLIIPEATRKYHEEGFRRYLSTGIARIIDKRVNVVALKKDGTTIDIELGISPVRYDAHTFFTAVIRDVTDLKKSEQRTKMLVDELNHRVRNTLTIVQSMAKQTVKASKNLKQFDGAFEKRLVALSINHDLLTDTNWKPVALRDIFDAAFRPYLVSQISLQGGAISISPKAALVIGMSIHEMATNAAKYGALSVIEGLVKVEWSIKDNDLIIQWKETNGPKVSPPTRQGYGSKLIRIGLEMQLGGTYSLFFPETGLVGQVRIPMKNLQE
jgi:PAS domain S-box-containing protein